MTRAQLESLRVVWPTPATLVGKRFGDARKESNPRDNVNPITYSAADGTFYLVFDVKQCERHGQRHGTFTDQPSGGFGSGAML
jgi:hypothetical protein